MPTLKVNISFERYRELEEAADFFGTTIQEAYSQMIDKHLEEFSKIMSAIGKPPNAKHQEKTQKELAASYKQVNKRKEKERKEKRSNGETNVIMFSPVTEEV